MLGFYRQVIISEHLLSFSVIPANALQCSFCVLMLVANAQGSLMFFPMGRSDEMTGMIIYDPWPSTCLWYPGILGVSNMHLDQLESAKPHQASAQRMYQSG